MPPHLPSVPDPNLVALTVFTTLQMQPGKHNKYKSSLRLLFTHPLGKVEQKTSGKKGKVFLFDFW
jgi:hypothetical protein